MLASYVSFEEEERVMVLQGSKERLTAGTIARQCTKFLAEGWKDDKLDETAGNTVDGEDGSDRVRSKAEAASEAEGELRILWGMFDGRVIEENGEHLIISDGMKGEKGIGKKTNTGLRSENLLHTRAVGLWIDGVMFDALRRD